MAIDWITVSAQIVNFLILVWLLKRFLYQPIIRAMDRREQRIAERLNEALAREQKANEAQHDYQAKQKELEQKKDEILSGAKEDVEQKKKQWLMETRGEVAETRNDWQRQVDQEKAEFLGNLRHQAGTTIQAIARKVLSDLANTDLEAHIIHVFIKRLASLDKSARKAFADTDEPVHLASSFELEASLRSRLTQAIHGHIAEGVSVNYAKSPDLLCGIELTRGGQRLSWNLAEYLETLDARIEAAFASTAQTEKEA